MAGYVDGGPAGGGGLGAFDLTRAQLGTWTARGNASLMNVDGLLEGCSTADGGASLQVGTSDGLALQQLTSATAGTNAGLQPSAWVGSFGMRPVFWGKVRVQDLTASRYRAGLFGAQSVFDLGSADPTNPTACFEVGVDQGHTSWHFVTRNAGGTVTRIDTGVAFTLGAVYFLQFEIPSIAVDSIDWSIFDKTGTQLQNGSMTADLPDALDPMVYSLGARNLSNGTQRSVRHFFGGLALRAEVT